MKFNRRQSLVLSAGAATFSVAAQSSKLTPSYPSKPVRVLISVPPGGTMDVLTRAIANHAKDSFGTILLEHKSGANGNIAMEVVKAAEPDGHTLILGTASMLTMNPYAYKEVRFDVVRDFEPIVLAARFELVLVAYPSVPANNLQELVAWLKANPTKATIASYGAGTPSHFLIEMLSEATALKITHVPYRGATQAMQDTLSGQVPLFFSTVGQVVSAIADKRLKAYATTGEKRSPFLPALPSLVELGYPKLSASAWFSYLAPKGTPAAVIDRLNAVFNQALQSREVRSALLSNGMYPVGGTRQELAQTIAKDAEKWKRVIAQTGFVAS